MHRGCGPLGVAGASNVSPGYLLSHQEMSQFSMTKQRYLKQALPNERYGAAIYVWNAVHKGIFHFKWIHMNLYKMCAPTHPHDYKHNMEAFCGCDETMRAT